MMTVRQWEEACGAATVKVRVSTARMVTGRGSAFPVEFSVTETVPLISVAGGLNGSKNETNSCTVPVTVTLFPMAAAAGTGLPVKTMTASDVDACRACCRAPARALSWISSSSLK